MLPGGAGYGAGCGPEAPPLPEDPPLVPPLVPPVPSAPADPAPWPPAVPEPDDPPPPDPPADDEPVPPSTGVPSGFVAVGAPGRSGSPPARGADVTAPIRPVAEGCADPQAAITSPIANAAATGAIRRDARPW